MPSIRITSAASSPQLPQDEAELAWLAGLLEGEGTFGYFKDQLNVGLSMTDIDVVARVAKYFGTSVASLAARKEHHRTAYAVRVRGGRAALVMQTLLPLMGERRSAAIRHSLVQYEREILESRKRKLNIQQKRLKLYAEWQQAQKCGQSFRGFCAERGISRRQTELVIQVLEEKRTGVCQSADRSFSASPVASFSSLSDPAKLAWLAGLLEGEGWFGPKARGGLAIYVSMVDQDVIERAAMLLEAKVFFLPRRQEHWQDAWFCTASTKVGRKVGRHLLPWMGHRRASKISEALFVPDSVPDYRPIGRHEHRVDEAKSAWARRNAGEGLRPVARRLGLNHETLRRLLSL